jgi:hypothetical protein
MEDTESSEEGCYIKVRSKAGYLTQNHCNVHSSFCTARTAKSVPFIFAFFQPIVDNLSKMFTIVYNGTLCIVNGFTRIIHSGLFFYYFFLLFYFKSISDVFVGIDTAANT